MGSAVLWVDEPFIGLDARVTAMIFDALCDLQRREGRTIDMVEQNVLSGLELAISTM